MHSHNRLAYIHVAYFTAAVLGFLRCHMRRWSKTVTVSPCWKIFSTVFANSLYYHHAISDGSTVVDVGGANNRNCPDKIVPPVGFQRESEYIRQSMSVDLRRRARPWRKTGDIPPDRTETRPETRDRTGDRSPEGRPNLGDRSVVRIPKATERSGNTGAGRKPETSHSSADVGRTSEGEEPTNQKPPQVNFVAGARFCRHAYRQSVYRPAYQPALLELFGFSG